MVKKYLPKNVVKYRLKNLFLMKLPINYLTLWDFSKNIWRQKAKSEVVSGVTWIFLVIFVFIHDGGNSSSLITTYSFWNWAPTKEALLLDGQTTSNLITTEQSTGKGYTYAQQWTRMGAVWRWQLLFEQFLSKAILHSKPIEKRSSHWPNELQQMGLF